MGVGGVSRKPLAAPVALQIPSVQNSQYARGVYFGWHTLLPLSSSLTEHCYGQDYYVCLIVF